VLDGGCGRGLLLIATALRLTTAKETGVGPWRVSGTPPEAVEENAAREGVRGRIEVKHGDARQVPFPDNSFDVVVSNFVHELKTDREREKMARELARVLKASGHLALADFIFTSECVQVLRQCGLADAQRSRDGLVNFWITAILSLGTDLSRHSRQNAQPLGAPASSLR
jgi:ubiquinone/menaquinone biosynthesis C-methylase UbiE